MHLVLWAGAALPQDTHHHEWNVDWTRHMTEAIKLTTSENRAQQTTDKVTNYITLEGFLVWRGTCV